MEKTWKKWTKEDESIVLREIKKSPNNLKSAFRRAADKTGRTEHSVSIQWYRKLSKSSTVFMLVGQNTVNNNRKNSKNNSKIKTSIWTIIKKLFI